MSASDPFGPITWYDPAAVSRRRGMSLPHYEIPGAIYFVTFRLWDSVPEDVYNRLASARDEFLVRNPPPHDPEQETELKRLYYAPMERWLDKGIGNCALRDPQVRSTLQRIMTKFDGQRYQLGEYVIMPNHVHVIMRVADGIPVAKQCRSWKSLSAVEINRQLDRNGRFWQPDSFDHIVRSPAKLHQTRDYIAQNPAGFSSGDYTFSNGTLVTLMDIV